MRVRQTFLSRVFSMNAFVRVLLLGLGLCLSGLLLSPRTMAQNQNATYIPATAAFDNSPVCDDTDLHNDSDEARGRPEWKSINIDPTLPFPNNFLHPLTILEGRIPTPGEEYPSGELENNQAPSEVSEEEITWNHYTHDFTANVVPDPAYQYLLSSYANPPNPANVTPTNPTGRDLCPDGTYSDPCHHVHMEVEWENASLMDEGDGFQRIWGAVPEFVWPAVNDRVWVAGRWVFDCGHPSAGPNGETALVKYSTEIHPPRALVTFRLNHPALDSFPVPRTSAPNFPGPQSFLPVTGGQATVPPGHPNSGPTNVPVTEADIFVSGNGGGANDACQLTHNPGDDCGTPHTSPVIPLNGPNDPNYVFDIYPPGTDYNAPLLAQGTFSVTPPVANAALQWRIVDHSSELPAHTCGGSDTSGCVSAVPIFCLLDASTPPPNQTETKCPSVPAANPTRLRVILPFAGTNANFFAQSILLGWDDVPGGPAQILLASANTKPNVFAGSVPLMQIGLPGPVSTPIIRTFKVTLHALTVVANGEGTPLLGAPDGDWRVFVNVGGQYRYMDPFFDRNPDGSNKCNGDALTENGDGDCFLFDDTPWIVSVQDGTPIHVGVGGWESDRVDSHFCRNYNDPDPNPAGCAPDSVGDLVALATANNDRIGTYEFDLKAPDYQWSDAPSFTTENTGDNCSLEFSLLSPLTCDELQYKVEFAVEEIPAAAAPTASPLQIGVPHYINYLTSATPLVLSTTSTDAEYFQYRFHFQGAALTTYAPTAAMNNAYSVPAPLTLPFPVYWTSAPIDPGSLSATLHLGGADGPYDLQYSAQSFGQLLEPRHTDTVILDNTPPVIGIVQPQPTTYPHSAVLTLNYNVSDAGSGVNQFTSLMDGMSTVFGHGLASGQAINLLTELTLGPHTFSIMALDNVGNSGSQAVTFTIIVTPESIKGDVTQFLGSGELKNQGEAQSLLAKLDAAATARASGDCATANNIYQAFINELNAQSGKGIDATAAQIMIADAQYLMAHCP